MSFWLSFSAIIATLAAEPVLVALSRVALCLLFSLLIACSDQPGPSASLGEAYVGPKTLTLRQALALKSPVTATVKHGDKLQILEYRYRLVRVRTAQGAEGWTDMRQLLTPEHMNALDKMAQAGAKYPSQGSATVFDSLNMHTESNRSSPSFWQVPENGKVDVIGHKLAPRIQAASVTAPIPVKPAAAPKKTKQQQTKIGPPPRPPAPKIPDNWLAISVPKTEHVTPEVPKPDPPAARPVPMDDWSLVRTPEGKVGWVLTRPLIMAIPDEVAQYAEGHRITAYFALGQVQDGDLVKNNWLWTTIGKGLEPYEFDSFRVFVWTRQRHRYETAYIERNVVGHYPIEVKNSAAGPSFSLILEDSDGQLYRSTYSFEGNRVRRVAKDPYNAAAPRMEISQPAPNAPTQQQPAVKRSLFARLKDRVHRLFR